jgi:V8-like Glu-specific endopeptidase
VVNAQLPHGGKPYPFTSQKSSVKPIILTGFDIQQAIDESLTQESASGKKPFKFAWNYTLDLSPENSGYWMQTADGTRIWRIHLVAPDAKLVNVDFSRFNLKPGSRIFIYPPDQNSFIGGFNYQNNSSSESLPTEFIKGQELIVEMQTDPGVSDYGSLTIGSLAHAYIDIFKSQDTDAGYSGACNVDINCPQGDDWQLIKKAVCKYTFKVGASTESCTGTLINNTALDTLPYILTANHCITFASQAPTAVFYFNYEKDTCGKASISIPYTLAGSTLKATSDSIDFSLLLLNESPPDAKKPYYAGWSVSQTPATSAVCIHHPQGDVKKISIETGALTSEYQSPIPTNLMWLTKQSVPQAFWRVVNWETGTTEGGSSGSPLFNQNKLIVGNLTGGQADCVNSVNDYFSKLYVGWEHYPATNQQLKHWLDPLNAGVTSLPGFDPFGKPDTAVIDTTKYAERFIIFPNPATDIATFETDTMDISGGKLCVFSLTGKKIAEYDIQETKRLSFNVSFLSQGVYIIEFSKGNVRERKRLLIINPQK